MISHKNITKPKSKGNNVKPTTRQRKVAMRIIENGGNMSRTMREVGYSPATAENPKKIAESKGFIQVMQSMGLTEELLTSCLVEDIHRKKDNRLGELTLGFKLHGKLRDTQEGNKTLILITSGESATRYNLPVKDNTTS